MSTLTQKTFLLEIVTPERKVFGGEAAYASFPGIEGEFGVMAGHAATLAILVPGVIKVTCAGKDEYFATVGGFVEILRNKATVAVESAEKAGDIDKGATERELRDAAAALHSATDKVAKKTADDRVRRANARLKAVSLAAGH